MCSPRAVHIPYTVQTMIQLLRVYTCIVRPLDRKFNVPCTNLFAQRSTGQFMHETASCNIHQLITSEQDILFTSSSKVDVVRVQTSELQVSTRLNFELHASTNQFCRRRKN